MTSTETIPVVAAVLRNEEGRLLIARRPEHKRHGGLWEFPGGKVDHGESLADAVVRELAEELELTAPWIGGEPVFEKQDPGQPFQILFLEAQASGRPELHEHSALAWVPIPVPREYRLAPSDAAFVEALATGEARVGAAPVTRLES